jgi:hypothetical protein
MRRTIIETPLAGKPRHMVSHLSRKWIRKRTIPKIEALILRKIVARVCNLNMQKQGALFHLRKTQTRKSTPWSKIREIRKR